MGLTDMRFLKFIVILGFSELDATCPTCSNYDKRSRYSRFNSVYDSTGQTRCQGRSLDRYYSYANSRPINVYVSDPCQTWSLSMDVKLPSRSVYDSIHDADSYLSDSYKIFELCFADFSAVHCLVSVSVRWDYELFRIHTLNSGDSFWSGMHSGFYFDHESFNLKINYESQAASELLTITYYIDGRNIYQRTVNTRYQEVYGTYNDYHSKIPEFADDTEGIAGFFLYVRKFVARSTLTGNYDQIYLSNIIFDTTCTLSCDECTLGLHSCAENALCEDTDISRSNTVTCPLCASGYTGEPYSQCVDCSSNPGVNCLSERSGCSGNLPFKFSKTNLMECLNLHSSSFSFENTNYIPKSIMGKQSNTQIQFYQAKSDKPFLYYDHLYETWRMGGGNTATEEVSCSNLPICN